MIWGVGLPRCAGQTLQLALSILTGRVVWHSIEPHRWDDSIMPEDAGAVEIYAPLKWLADYPGGPHLFIYNYRDKDSWLESCARVYDKAHSRNWNHPIWRHPLNQFSDYYDEYTRRIYTSHVQIHRVNLIDNPGWEVLCDILGSEVPNQPFPNRDPVSGHEDIALGLPHHSPLDWL